MRDLTERLSACRSCLPATHHNMSICGGGAGWRQHRKQLRRKQREQRRSRKKLSNKSTNANISSSSTSSTDSFTETTTKTPDIMADTEDYSIFGSWGTDEQLVKY